MKRSVIVSYQFPGGGHERRTQRGTLQLRRVLLALELGSWTDLRFFRKRSRPLSICQTLTCLFHC